MPVKPENAARYPADWPEIAAGVKAAAGWKCQGCGLEHGEGIWRGKEDGRSAFRRLNDPEMFESCDSETGQPIPGSCWDSFERTGHRPTRIILTVAHLDHQPENCAPENLRCWCQWHHITYDAKHHATNAAATRRAKKADGDLFP